MGGKADRGRMHQPPAADYRKKTGNHTAKLGKKELKETESAALARKQPDPFPLKKVVLSLAIFGAVSACLYAYLQYVLADDDDDLER